MKKQGFTLVEVLTAITVMAILTGLAGPPIMGMLKRSRVEDSASAMHETIKSAQVEAQKRGDVEVVSGLVRKRKVYVAVYPADMVSTGNPPNTIRALSWTDNNNDNLKTTAEFTVLQETSLGKASFSLPASVTKKACNNSAGAPASSIVNFTATTCPPNSVTYFPDGTRCIKLNGKGFNESMNNDTAYITGNGETFAVTVNPAGLTALCRWDGTNWINVR